VSLTSDRQDLEISLLRTFLAVVQHGSMGRTAAAGTRTQPAVSQRILRLEKIIGRKLFYRSRNGVKLTSHGELLVQYARRAIDLNEEALARLRGGSASGPLRLGVSEQTALAALAPALKRFQKAQPDVELNLMVAAPAKLEFLLTQGELDFVITDPTQIEDRPIVEWRSRLTWFARRDFSIDPLKPLPLVLCASTNWWRDKILSSLRRSGWEWRVVFESASWDATLAALDSGMGVSALLPEAVRSTGIIEVDYARLPLLPEVRFGMFRSPSVATKATALIETALASSLQPSIGNRPRYSAQAHGSPLDEDPFRAAGSSPESDGATL